MLEYLKDPTILELIFSILAGIWTFIRATEFYKEHVGEKYQLLVDLVESSVVKIYETYVRERKADTSTAPEGKLAENERSVARDRAISLVKDLAAERGLDIKKLVGSDEELEALVQKTVNELKSKYKR